MKRFREQDVNRAKRIIDKTISLLNLDLEGLTILTEVGSNSFIYTPLIALLANAKQVYAWTKDTSYGNGNDIIGDCLEIANYLNVNSSRLEFAINQKPEQHILEADIITNSRMLRPLDKSILIHAKEKAVIPLMYEAWEWRDGEIDKKYCNEKGIKIGGTWENHPDLKIFDYCGSLGIKMMNEAGLEIFQNKIIVWGDDHFGKVITQSFVEGKASEVILTTDLLVLNDNLHDMDALFICDYQELKPIIGQEGFIDLELIKRKNPSIIVVHLFGDVDNQYCSDIGITIYPEKRGKPTFMTHTLAEIGLNPILKLQTAGLKVGEILWKNMDHNLCQKIN